MKLIILGGSGNTGSRLIRMAVKEGHTVTAFVRDRTKLQNTIREMVNKIDVIEGDITDQRSLVDAIRSHDVVINAAGNAQQDVNYHKLITGIIKAAEIALPVGGRFWLFGGAAILQVPDTNFTMLRFRQIPSVYKAHAKNLALVENTTLDWSMLCPGPMIAATNGQPHEGLRVSRNCWPVQRSRFTKFLPNFFLLVDFMRKMPTMTVTYEDAARVILRNLNADGDFSRARVGIALPPGLKLHKHKNIRSS